MSSFSRISVFTLPYIFAFFCVLGPAKCRLYRYVRAPLNNIWQSVPTIKVFKLSHRFEGISIAEKCWTISLACSAQPGSKKYDRGVDFCLETRHTSLLNSKTTSRNFLILHPKDMFIYITIVSGILAIFLAEKAYFFAAGVAHFLTCFSHRPRAIFKESRMPDLWFRLSRPVALSIFSNLRKCAARCNLTVYNYTGICAKCITLAPMMWNDMIPTLKKIVHISRILCFL